METRELEELIETDNYLSEIEKPIKACTNFYHHTKGGKIVTWGAIREQTNPPNNSTFIEIACGQYHNVALKNDGTIKTWGYNYMRQNNYPKDNGYVAIACGREHSVALKKNGKIVTWTRTQNGQTNDSPTEYDYIKIACGAHHNVALKKNGSVYTWGRSENIKEIIVIVFKI